MRRRVCGSTLSAGIAILGLVAPATASATVACRPTSGVQTHDVATAPRLGGAETTQYLADGGYRVTRCDAARQVRREQLVVPLATRSGMRLTPVSTFVGHGAGQGGTLVSVTLAADSQGVLLPSPDPRAPAPGTNGDRIPPTEPIAAHPSRLRPRARPAGSPACSQRSYSFAGLRVHTGRYAYYANRARMPHGEADRVAITKGHRTWNDTVSDCGFPDVTTIRATYAGVNNRVTAHTYNDGINLVDFGRPANLGCSAQAPAIVLACMVATTADGVHFSGIDLRFTNAPGVWSIAASPPANRFDLWSAAAHESGHAIGLGHAAGDFLTMYSSTGMGQVRQRDLGLGDAVGLRCRYGVTAGGC